MHHWLLVQAQEVTPENPASLAWPVIAGGVAAIVTTASIVLGFLWWLWKRVHERIVNPLATIIADWRGRPAENGQPAVPGFSMRISGLERHIGNGIDKPLRTIVEENSIHVERATDTAQRGQEAAVAATALAQQNATALADHYVRGHGT